jgi:hypothetical protein
METYLCVVKKIIENFEYDYPTVGSLQNILHQINHLSVDEKLKYQTYIFSINEAIANCGSDNKRLTDKQANNILGLLRGSVLFIPLPNNKLVCVDNSFYLTIKELLDTFDYETVGSLQGIIVKIESYVTIKESEKHHKSITEINRIIKSFGKNYSRALTEWQRSVIFKVLEDSITYKSPTIVKNDPTTFKLHTIVKKEKFPPDDIIHEVVYNLITKLTNDVMASSITTYVVDYLEVVKYLLEGDLDRYNNITSEINECLKDHNWQNGFQKEPNREALLIDLQEIANDYF